MARLLIAAEFRLIWAVNRLLTASPAASSNRTKRHSISKSDAEQLAIRLQAIVPNGDGGGDIDLQRTSFHRARNSLIKVAKESGEKQRRRAGGGGESIDATWVFSVLTMLCDTDIRQCLQFLFDLFASRSGKQSQRAFAEMLISVSGAVALTLGKKMPDLNVLENKARDAIDILAKLIPKDMQATTKASNAQYLTFTQFWDLCQDDIEIAKYIDSVLALRKN